MAPIDEGQMNQAIQVRDQLAGRFLYVPGVSAVDIGYVPNEGDPPGNLVVRIHVKDKETLKKLDIPETVNEIPIQVIVSNYQLE